MKLKTAAAFAGAAMILFSSGCSFLELSFDDALRPPKTTGDEAEIEILISESANGSYTLKYPKSGNYRSAIIMKDLDGDETDEAIAFFKGKDEIANVHMLVMYEDSGKWKTAGDFITETTDVDSVDFADINNADGLEIIVGYTTYTPNVNFLSCFTYDDGKTDTITAGQNYSSFYCGSVDSSNRDKIITLSLYNADSEAKAAMLEYSADKKALYSKSQVQLDPNIVKYKNVVFSDFGNGTKGIVIDGAAANEELNTEVIYFNSELAVLRNPLYKEKTKNVTQRSLSVMSADIDNDTRVEIPVAEKLPHGSGDSAQGVADKITWYNFSSDGERLVQKSKAIVNYSLNLSFRVPEQWSDNTYTAVNNSADNSITVSEWNKQEIGKKLFEIKAFDTEAWDQGKDNDGYQLINRDTRLTYAFINAESDSPLALTDDEIKTAFSLLSGTAE